MAILADICKGTGIILKDYDAGTQAINALGVKTMSQVVSGFALRFDEKYYIFYDGTIPKWGPPTS